MSDPVPPPPEAVVTQMIFGKWVAMALSVAAKLRVADALASGPKAVADLAADTNTHPPSLYRVLRALASVGVFAEDADGRFGQTPLSEVLRSGVTGSVRAVAEYCGADWSWRPWGRLLETVRTGRTAFDDVFGEQAFDYPGGTRTTRPLPRATSSGTATTAGVTWTGTNAGGSVAAARASRARSSFCQWANAVGVTPSRAQKSRAFRPLTLQRASRFRQTRSRAGSGTRVGMGASSGENAPSLPDPATRVSPAFNYPQVGVSGFIDFA